MKYQILIVCLLFLQNAMVHPRGSSAIRDAYRSMALAYSPNGAHIAAGLDRGGVKVWYLSTGTDRILGGGIIENTPAYCTIEIIKYSPKGNFIASLS
jgi:hypothetical protein